MVIKLKCSECGGNIELDNNREFGYCQFCGTKIYLENSEYAKRVNAENNYIHFAEIELEENNFKNAYDVLNKALEINANNKKALFLRSICVYYLDLDFFKIANLYRKYIQEDSKNIDFYAYHFSDILYNYADEFMKSEYEISVVLDLAKTLIGTKNIDVLEYMNTFRLETERLYTQTLISFSMENGIFNVLSQYNQIIKALGGVELDEKAIRRKRFWFVISSYKMWFIYGFIFIALLIIFW